MRRSQKELGMFKNVNELVISESIIMTKRYEMLRN